MSSWKNAMPSRAHKERSQPARRARLGLLEKKKDYKLRAKNYHRKEDRIRAMRLKAALRNPDEFNFGMVKKKTEGGLHRYSDASEQLTPEELKLLKSQDLTYITTKGQIEKKKVAKLRENLHFLDAPKKNTHMLFLDDEKEMEEFSAAAHFDTVPELADRAYNRPRKATLAAAAPTAPLTKKQLRKVKKKRDATYAELEARLQRSKKIARTEAHMQTQKKLAGKGRRRKVKAAADGKPAVYKWSKVRKK